MSSYTLIMWAYTALAAFMVVVLFYNLFKCKNFWEQIVAFLVIYPFILRMFFIK